MQGVVSPNLRGRFLIAGLPRSRTAWFSVATGALHEPISQQGWDAFAPRWFEGLGVSDSGAGMRLPEILERFEPKTLIIERPMADVVKSFKAYVGDLPMDWDVMDARLWDLKVHLDAAQSPLIKRVNYADLEIPGVMLSCMNWLGVKPVNLGQLCHMRIESDWRWNLELLRQRAA